MNDLEVAAKEIVVWLQSRQIPYALIGGVTRFAVITIHFESYFGDSRKQNSLPSSIIAC